MTLWYSLSSSCCPKSVVSAMFCGLYELHVVARAAAVERRCVHLQLMAGEGLLQGFPTFPAANCLTKCSHANNTAPQVFGVVRGHFWCTGVAWYLPQVSLFVTMVCFPGGAIYNQSTRVGKPV